MRRGIPPIIPCELLPETRKRIKAFADALRKEAPAIGNHGLNAQDFWESGLFASAVQRIRGQIAASMREKRAFMEQILDYLKSQDEIADWVYAGGGERHDYEVKMPNTRISIVEAKGCLDGNNTNIFERPPQADEFIIWSLCQNPGADPRKNAWSGIHTRLSAELIHKQQRIDGVVIWDMLCGTMARPCPKLTDAPDRATPIGEGRQVPPPCLYLFPRSIPDPRNNPNPESWTLSEVPLLKALYSAFGGMPSDLTTVHVEARMRGTTVQRRTRYSRCGAEFCASNWTAIRRARR